MFQYRNSIVASRVKCIPHPSRRLLILAIADCIILSGLSIGLATLYNPPARERRDLDGTEDYRAPKPAGPEPGGPPNVLQCAMLIPVIILRFIIIYKSKGRYLFAPFCDQPGTPIFPKFVGRLYGLRYVFSLRFIESHEIFMYQITFIIYL